MFGTGSLNSNGASSNGSGGHLDFRSGEDAVHINDDNGDGRGRFSKVLQ